MESSSLNSGLPLNDSDIQVLKTKLKSNRLWIVKICLIGIALCFFIPLIPSRYSPHSGANGNVSNYWNQFIFISLCTLLGVVLISVGRILKEKEIKKDLKTNTKQYLRISGSETKEKRIDLFENNVQNIGFTKADILKCKDFLYSLGKNETALISYCSNSKSILDFSSEQEK
jgi:hypothetical protein